MPLSSSPEAKLVFRTAALQCDGAEYAALVGAVGDWERCVFLADREMAASSLARAIRESGASPPEAVTDHLRRAMMFGDFRMQLLAHRLRETTRALAEAGVPVMLLKGAAVGALWDPTFRLRPMSDLDILIRREDVAKASSAVRSAGWEQTSDGRLIELLADGHQHLPPFFDARLPGARLEVHVSLFPADHPFALEDAELWRDASPAPAPFTGALVPSAEHLLLHACIHFAWQHALLFGAWRSFRVVAVALGIPGFSWTRFVALARATRAATACYWTLRLAERMCAIPVPASALSALAPPTAELVRNALERHIIASLVPGESPPSPSLGLSRLLWRAALRPRWSGHPRADRFAADERWHRALEGEPPASLADRLRRHAGGVRRWLDFVSHTLFGQPGARQTAAGARTVP
jgi:Uncharacterised nucleotidyltransferase